MRARLWPHTRLRSSSATTILLFVVVCVLGAGAAVCPGVASARTVARGIADTAFTALSTTPDQQAAMLHETRYELDATYVRFFVSWAAAEPQQPVLGQPVYDPNSAYMLGVASAVSQARQDGLKVIITFDKVPEWASDPTFWKQTNGYQPYDAMSTKYLSAFRAFCQAVAAQFQGQVYAYECWNEPNLYLSLFPQQTKHDILFGAHLYVRMLRSFSAGIRAGDPGSAGAPRPLVIAGATSPRGSANRNTYETSPQRFAAVIKATKGWASLFDAYSHHPYMPGASPRLWPEAAPGSPNTTVTLENLGTLLKLFPGKPFFLTEYGYQTAACQAFTGQHVNQITQANVPAARLCLCRAIQAGEAADVVRPEGRLASGSALPGMVYGASNRRGCGQARLVRLCRGQPPHPERACIRQAGRDAHAHGSAVVRHRRRTSRQCGQAAGRPEAPSGSPMVDREDRPARSAASTPPSCGQRRRPTTASPGSA